jgi:hypothetical protein
MFMSLFLSFSIGFKGSGFKVQGCSWVKPGTLNREPRTLHSITAMALLKTIVSPVLAWTMYPPSVFQPSVVNVSPGYTLLENLALNSFSRSTSPPKGPLTNDRVAIP